MKHKSYSIVLTIALMTGAPVRGQELAAEPETPSIQLEDAVVNHFLTIRHNVILMQSVQDELKVSETQRKEIAAIAHRCSDQFEKVIANEHDRRKRHEATRAVFKEEADGLEAVLKPEQRERVDQLQIQGKGPLAFTVRSDFPLNTDFPDVPQRLALTEKQVNKIKTIVDSSRDDIRQAAAVPITLDGKRGVPNAEIIRKYVESAEFRTAKQKARAAVSQTSARVVSRIEEVLTKPQRAAYRKLLGPPFDLSKLAFKRDQAAFEAQMVERALSPNPRGMGQRADPDFDTKVARPAYTARHPRILFDEAHRNFHTALGRYKPFADLIAHDGCEVVPNRATFTPNVLAKGQVLVIANALGSRGGDEAKSAFSDAECDAVRDWVRAGGSLLLITDHAPFGASSESLARRFGVEMGKAVTTDPAHSEGNEARLVFTRQNKLLGDHPITNGRDASERIGRIQTFTGQSLKGPEGSVAILRLSDTAVDRAARDARPTSAAGRAQGVAFTFGKGRVVVLGEAAELSAQLIGTRKFGMNVPGLDNRQMALNIVHWLSGLLEPRKEGE